MPHEDPHPSRTQLRQVLRSPALAHARVPPARRRPTPRAMERVPTRVRAPPPQPLLLWAIVQAQVLATRPARLLSSRPAQGRTPALTAMTMKSRHSSAPPMPNPGSREWLASSATATPPSISLPAALLGPSPIQRYSLRQSSPKPVSSATKRPVNKAMHDSASMPAPVLRASPATMSIQAAIRSSR